MARIAKHTAEETKAAIQNAFVELYMEERLEKVTVGAISERAGVNRGTFYHYYQDVYDLLEQIENQYLIDVAEIIPNLIYGIMHQTLPKHLTKMKSFYTRYHDILLLFLVRQPNPKILSHTKRMARQYVLQEMGLAPEDVTQKQRCLIEYIASAQIGLISWWLENGTLTDLPQLAHTMVQANTQGALTTLLENC